MIVHRFTYRVKPGRTSELVQLTLDEWKRGGSSVPHRVYVPVFGPRDQVCMEVEFADLAERKKFWDEWWNQPTTPAFVKKWNELVDSGGSEEIWVLRT